MFLRHQDLEIPLKQSGILIHFLFCAAGILSLGADFVSWLLVL
jgi:hypothetical protein